MNEDLKNRLTNYAETPPAASWQRIADALDTPAFVQKLQGFETAPPLNGWEKLELRLEQPAAKVVPLRVKLFKIAMAAAVLIVLALGSVFYLKMGSKPNLARTEKPTDSFSSEKNIF